MIFGRKQYNYLEISVKMAIFKSRSSLPSMKKTENLLLLPFVLAIIGMFFMGNSTIDIHLHDTYYIIAHFPVELMFLGWLIILFLLYKLIRKRHGSINNKWAIPHILITTILIGIISFSYLLILLPPDAFSNSPEIMLRAVAAYDRYNKLLIISSPILLLVQVIFLLYFIRMMIKPRPLANSR